MDGRVTVHEGDFADVLPTLEPGYDLAFFDGHHAGAERCTQSSHRLLRPRGVLVTANLNHGGTADAVLRGAVRPAGRGSPRFVDEDRETAISVKL